GGASRSYGGSHGLSSNSYRKNATVGGFGSSRGHVGSKSMGSAGGSRGNGKEKITPISDVDPMFDDISIQGRCISIWHSHGMNGAHDPYSLDLVLQDAHVYIKKEFMFRFEPLFEVGQCYILSNFGIAENSGRLPLLPHIYKISFCKCTTATRIEPFDSNTNGFILKPFNHLLNPEHHQYYENDDVDLIGSVVGIDDIVLVMSVAGLPSIHNALFRTNIFINRNISKIEAFKKRVQERDGYEANQVKIELFSHEVKVVSIAEFFHGAINRMVNGICDSEPDSHCIVYARIHRIHKEYAWACTACKSCNKKWIFSPAKIDHQFMYVNRMEMYNLHLGLRCNISQFQKMMENASE
nr:hypothetical protein [Tanacetum cinerariifolium]GEY26379.1 hypothetical protein [Tanacetum cinerariifolium]